MWENSPRYSMDWRWADRQGECHHSLAHLVWGYGRNRGQGLIRVLTLGVVFFCWTYLCKSGSCEILTCVSTAQARAKFASEFWSASCPRHFSWKILRKTSLAKCCHMFRLRRLSQNVCVYHLNRCKASFAVGFHLYFISKSAGGGESHSIHCPTKMVVWDCDIGTDHPDVPADVHFTAVARG